MLYHSSTAVRYFSFYICEKSVNHVNSTLTCSYIYWQFVVISIFLNAGSQIIYYTRHMDLSIKYLLTKFSRLTYGDLNMCMF